MHGGIATNQSYQTLAPRLEEWAEHIRLSANGRGARRRRLRIGPISDRCRNPSCRISARSIVEPAIRGTCPLGPSFFDRGVWLATRSPASTRSDLCSSWSILLESEFRQPSIPGISSGRTYRAQQLRARRAASASNVCSQLRVLWLR